MSLRHTSRHVRPCSVSQSNFRTSTILSTYKCVSVPIGSIAHFTTTHARSLSLTPTYLLSEPSWRMIRSRLLSRIYCGIMLMLPLPSSLSVPSLYCPQPDSAIYVNREAGAHEPHETPNCASTRRGTFIRPKDSCWPEVALARARSVPEFIRPMCSCWPEVEVARSGQKAAYRVHS